MVGQRRHVGGVGAEGAPIGGKAEFFIGPGKAVEEVRRFERRRAVEEVAVGERRPCRVAGAVEGLIDQCQLAEPEAIARPQAFRQIGDYLVVGATFARRLDDLFADLQKRMAVTAIQVVVLDRTWWPAAPGLRPARSRS